MFISGGQSILGSGISQCKDPKGEIVLTSLGTTKWGWDREHKEEWNKKQGERSSSSPNHLWPDWILGSTPVKSTKSLPDPGMGRDWSECCRIWERRTLKPDWLMCWWLETTFD